MPNRSEIMTTRLPTRVILGAEYKATEKVTLLAAQEFTWGSGASTQDTRLGMRSGLWEGADLTGTVERQFDENDDRVFANVGLKQTWKISDAWKVDAGLERQVRRWPMPSATRSTRMFHRHRAPLLPPAALRILPLFPEGQLIRSNR